MGKKRKLLNKILAGSRNIRFGEFTALMEAFGFTLRRITGSHRMYARDDISEQISVQPQSNGRAKPYQVRQFLKMIEAYGLALPEDSREDEEEGET